MVDDRGPQNPTHSAFPSPLSLHSLAQGMESRALCLLGCSHHGAERLLQSPVPSTGVWLSSFSLPVPEKWCLWAASPTSQAHVSPCLRARVPISQSSFPCAQRELLSMIGFRCPSDFLLFLHCFFPGLSYSLMSALLWIQCCLLAFLLIYLQVIWGLSIKKTLLVKQCALCSLSH